jgi:hypothetical protein
MAGTGFEDEEYKRLYKTGETDFLSCSYSLWWNYFGFDYPTTGRPYLQFAGPGKKSKTTLLLSDAVFYGDAALNKSEATDHWSVTHPFKGTNRTSVFMFLDCPDPGKKLLNSAKLIINAGYSDGRVVKVSIKDLVSQKPFVSISSTTEMYMPKDYK